jgi:hypothetical protein
MSNIPEWHTQHLVILKDWGEISASYRWLHYYTHIRYKIKNYAYMIPVIVLSTISGTANFAQSQIPGSFSNYFGLVVGFINILCAILTTIYQFTKISEMMESHRISSVSYGKLSRNIDIMINLPEEYRKISGESFIKECKSELDKLIDSSQTIPKDLLLKYSIMAKSTGIKQPEISIINPKSIYSFIENNNPQEESQQHEDSVDSVDSDNNTIINEESQQSEEPKENNNNETPQEPQEPENIINNENKENNKLESFIINIE